MTVKIQITVDYLQNYQKGDILEGKRNSQGWSVGISRNSVLARMGAQFTVLKKQAKEI